MEVLLYLLIIDFIIFIENAWLPITVLLLFIVGAIIVVKCLGIEGVRGKIIGIITGGFIGVVIPCVVVTMVLQSDFVKSRKNVDKDWMVGKTLEQVERRYSCPEYLSYPQFIKNKGKIICAREIYDWDSMDGWVSEYLYFAQVDGDGKICEVSVFDNNYEWAGTVIDHTYDRYEDRWGSIFIYKILSFSPSFRGPVDNKMGR